MILTESWLSTPSTNTCTDDDVMLFLYNLSIATSNPHYCAVYLSVRVLGYSLTLSLSVCIWGVVPSVMVCGGEHARTELL